MSIQLTHTCNLSPVLIEDSACQDVLTNNHITNHSQPASIVTLLGEIPLNTCCQDVKIVNIEACMLHETSSRGAQAWFVLNGITESGVGRFAECQIA